MAFAVDVAECFALFGDKVVEIGDVSGADLVAIFAFDVERAKLVVGYEMVAVAIRAGDELEGDLRFSAIQIVIEEVVDVEGQLDRRRCILGDGRVDFALAVGAVRLEAPVEIDRAVVLGGATDHNDRCSVFHHGDGGVGETGRVVVAGRGRDLVLHGGVGASGNFRAFEDGRSSLSCSQVDDAWCCQDARIPVAV